MVDLYKYFPTFIKMRDRLASQLSFDDPREAVLEKLTYMIEQMFDDTDSFIQALLNLNDPDAVEQKYFSHISYLLGTMLPNGATEEETRFIIKQLVYHYKTSGTHHSWHTAWRWSDQPDTKVVELFKRDQQEVTNYATVRSVNHPLKSARIQLGVCASSCESVCVNACESVCEAIVEVGTEVPVAEALRRLDFVEYLRPVHVILRQNAEDVQLRSGFPTSQDTIGHYPEVYGETPDPWLGSESFGEFRSEFFTIDDELSVDVQCVSLCEVSCQSCCEAVCECNPCEVVCQAASCQAQCTIGCQAGCEFSCEASCQFDCAAACQAGACTASCAGACLDSCQGSCADSCQAYCTDSACQINSCAESCQAYCTDSACQINSCASSCQAYCTDSACQINSCASSCQASCTTAGCEDHCQATACQFSYCMIAQCTTGGE